MNCFENLNPMERIDLVGRLYNEFHAITPERMEAIVLEELPRVEGRLEQFIQTLQEMASQCGSPFCRSPGTLNSKEEHKGEYLLSEPVPMPENPILTYIELLFKIRGLNIITDKQLIEKLGVPG
jgi:hypothetical protein